jgi:mRNA-degrading endonuclease RelE of RelBE toxin-antitoxin system
MIIDFTKPAEKQTKKLPDNIKRKFVKQLKFLRTDIHYPSLSTKRISATNRWEARIDYKYRFSFDLEEDIITITAVGMHDTGLGKK